MVETYTEVETSRLLQSGYPENFLHQPFEEVYHLCVGKTIPIDTRRKLGLKQKLVYSYLCFINMKIHPLIWASNRHYGKVVAFIKAEIVYRGL